ncbi:hypothetical protein JST97_31000 [bacterium]|nr:hypothetical protein [bacterium]
MRLELTCRDLKILACDSAWLDQAVAQDNPESKLVVDLRKVNEINALPENLKDKGISRVSIPVTARSWSEQDMDMLRREFARGVSPVVVLSAGGERAALMALQHVARVEQWSLEQALEKCPAVGKREELKKLLADYLARHTRS